MEQPDIEAMLGTTAERVEALLDHGYRAVWKVTAGGRSFAVKRWESVELLDRELEPHMHALRAGVPAPEVVAVAREPAPAMVTAWVDGVALGHYPGPEAWRGAGRVLRLVHQAAVLQPRSKDWAISQRSVVEEGISYLVERRGLDREDAKAALERAEELWPVVASRALVWLHGDAQPDHYIVNRAGHVLAVLDWADAEEGDALRDLAFLTLGREEALTDVLEGYGAGAELRDEAALLMPLYWMLRADAAARWLDEHGYPGREWPLEFVRKFARK